MGDASCHAEQPSIYSHSKYMRMRTRKEYIWFIYLIGPLFFGDLKNFPETKNNSRFYILKLYFLLHYNRFSCSVTSLLNIALQSLFKCFLFKIRKIDVFGQIGAFFCLDSTDRGRGQDNIFIDDVVMIGLYTHKV